MFLGIKKSKKQQDLPMYKPIIPDMQRRVSNIEIRPFQIAVAWSERQMKCKTEANEYETLPRLNADENMIRKN